MYAKGSGDSLIRVSVRALLKGMVVLQRRHKIRRLVFRLRFEPLTSQIPSATHSNTTSIYVDLNDITPNTAVIE